MIIVMSHTATDAEIKAVVDRVEEIGLKSELSRGEERTLVGVIGGNAYAYKDAFSHLGGIHEIIPITKPFKLASREFRRNDTIVDIGGLKIGNDEVVVMAGPCRERECFAAERSSRAPRPTRSRASANRRSR